MCATHFLKSPSFLDIPQEVMLDIFSYLDLPDLAALVQASPVLASLAFDPVLHRNRLKITAPARVRHSLFRVGPNGIPLRPTIGDLVHRDIIRGLSIERRWRTGLCFNSRSSVLLYESGLRLARRHVSDVISMQLKRRAAPPSNFLNSLHSSRILPDVESSSLTVSKSLLPVMHQLKWSLQRDEFSKMIKVGFCGLSDGTTDFGAWLEKRGRGIVQDVERVRLAICPDIRKMITFYEDLERSESGPS